MFGSNLIRSVPGAVAIEMIHTYSLIHDDLPAMDNDDFRRGKKTLHKKYDEAIAILTGDSLLTESFNLLVKKYGKKNPEICVKLIFHLAKSAGGGGLIGGQIHDLYPLNRTMEYVKKMQLMKTGELFICCAAFGAIIGNASDKDYKKMILIGDRLGRAFQIADDLLDISGQTKILGKKTRKDYDSGKITLLDLKGAKEAQRIAKSYIEESSDLLSKYGKKSKKLISLSNYILNRKS